MSTNHLFYLLIVGFLILTACAPQVPITSAPTSAPAPTEVFPVTPTTPAAAEAPPQEFKGHSSDVWGVAFSPDGKYLATGSSDKTARLWDVATGKEIRIFSGHTGEVGGVAFSPDGKYLLTGSVDKTARLWDVATGETVKSFSGHTSGVEVGGFSPDGKYMVTAGAFDLTGRVWDVASGETLHVLTGHSELVIRAAYSPDGKYVLTASVDGTARLWDTATGEEVRVLEHPNVPGAIAFSPDGKSVATGGEDNVIRLWDVASGELIDSFMEHTSFVQGVSFSPDGRYLLTGSDDKTARLWDLSTGETIRVFADHRGAVQIVTFSPDGNLIATASNDTVARVWDLQASPEDVAGPADAITLRLAVADQGGRPSEPYVLEFVDQVKTLSNGNITIEPIWDAGAATEAEFEVGVVQLVKGGQADLGLAGSRAFDVENIMSFQALQAPFLITDDALAKAVATSDISTRMLDGLSSAGIVGLTLWPEDLRHPFSVVPDKPILSPEDFEGATVRVVPSEVSHMLIKTLGGSPIFGDDYQAAESGLRQGTSLTGTPNATGNVIFFAKYQVLFANGSAFENLSEAQRAILRKAAAATQTKAIVEHPSEADAAAAWCADGGTVVMASEEQVAAFEAAAQPVFAKIAQDPLNAELIAAIRDLKAKTELAAGAEACSPGIPPQGAQPPAESSGWSEGLPPNGVWQVELSADDFAEMGVLRSVAESDWAGTYTLTLKDGKSFGEFHGLHGFYGKCQANYELVGNIVRFTYYQTTGGECEGMVEELQWRLDEKGLHFHLVAVKNGPPTELKAYYEAKPWQKVEEWSTGLPPNGVWQVELSTEDIAQFGVLQSTAADMAGTYTWTFQDGNAKIEIHGPKIEVSCMVVATTMENAVRLQNVGSSTCNGDAYDEVQWRLDTDGLHFHLVFPQVVELKATYEAKPWQKVGDQ